MLKSIRKHTGQHAFLLIQFLKSNIFNSTDQILIFYANIRPLHQYTTKSQTWRPITKSYSREAESFAKITPRVSERGPTCEKSAKAVFKITDSKIISNNYRWGHFSVKSFPRSTRSAKLSQTPHAMAKSNAEGVTFPDFWVRSSCWRIWAHTAKYSSEKIK
jgi:hypothetical protein